MTWVLDVEVESTPLSTTGGHTWAAARRLAAYLSAAAGQLGLERPGLQLLELGAGTGWLGCTVARNLHPTARVCLTEQAGGLDWLQHNVELNRQRGLPLAGVHVQPCDWLDYAGSGGAASTDAAAGSDGGGSRGAADSSTGCEQAEPTAGVVAAQAHKIHCDTDRMARGQQSPPPQQQQAEQRQELDSEQRRGGQRPQQASAGIAGSPFNGDGQQAGCGASVHLRETHWDFIIGSDLIYNEVGSRCLPRVLGALVRFATVALYCHTKHRFDLLDMEFFQELQGCGLQCEEVWEPGAPPPPASPPAQFPPVDLFPDQRIAVYRITRRS